jgi:hypothetical protein
VNSFSRSSLSLVSHFHPKWKIKTKKQSKTKTTKVVDIEALRVEDRIIFEGKNSFYSMKFEVFFNLNLNI